MVYIAEVVNVTSHPSTCLWKHEGIYTVVERADNLRRDYTPARCTTFYVVREYSNDVYVLHDKKNPKCCEVASTNQQRNKVLALNGTQRGIFADQWSPNVGLDCFHRRTTLGGQISVDWRSLAPMCLCHQHLLKDRSVMIHCCEGKSRGWRKVMKTTLNPVHTTRVYGPWTRAYALHVVLCGILSWYFFRGSYALMHHHHQQQQQQQPDVCTHSATPWYKLWINPNTDYGDTFSKFARLNNSQIIVFRKRACNLTAGFSLTTPGESSNFTNDTAPSANETSPFTGMRHYRCGQISITSDLFVQLFHGERCEIATAPFHLQFKMSVADRFLECVRSNQLFATFPENGQVLVFS